MQSILLISLLLVLLFLILLAVSILTCLILRVPFVPSSGKMVERMLTIAKLTAQDVVLDLGCGDGRLVHEAALRSGARAVGYELSVLPLLLGKWTGWLRKSPAQLKLQDFFGVSFGEATVIFTYLMPSVMKKLEPKIVAEGASGLRVIAHGFPFPGLTPVGVHRFGKGETIYEYQL